MTEYLPQCVREDILEISKHRYFIYVRDFFVALHWFKIRISFKLGKESNVGCAILKPGNYLVTSYDAAVVESSINAPMSYVFAWIWCTDRQRTARKFKPAEINSHQGTILLLTCLEGDKAIVRFTDNKKLFIVLE